MSAVETCFLNMLVLCLWSLLKAKKVTVSSTVLKCFHAVILVACH